MTNHLRAVFDTNVYLSAILSKNLNSPNKELMNRFMDNEFTLLVCNALLEELTEKLIEFDIARSDIVRTLQVLQGLAEWVDVPPEFITQGILPDPDDEVILACAILGHADYLVTYDPHFNILQGEYQGFKITKALPFLWAVRGENLVE